MPEPDESVRFVCVGCGTNQPKPAGYTQMDERYAVGFCNVCSDPKPRKTPRPTSQFIRADLFDQAAWDERRERATLRKHVTAYGSTTRGLQLMSNRAIWEMVTLFEKYGYPGMHITPEMRTFAHDYAQTNDNRKPKDKKSRGA